MPNQTQLIAISAGLIVTFLALKFFVFKGGDEEERAKKAEDDDKDVVCTGDLIGQISKLKYHFTIRAENKQYLLDTMTVGGKKVPQKFINEYNGRKVEHIGTYWEGFTGGLKQSLAFSSKFCNMDGLKKILITLPSVDVIGAERYTDFTSATASQTYNMLVDCNVFKVYLDREKAHYDYMTCNDECIGRQPLLIAPYDLARGSPNDYPVRYAMFLDGGAGETIAKLIDEQDVKCSKQKYSSQRCENSLGCSFFKWSKIENIRDNIFADLSDAYRGGNDDPIIKNAISYWSTYKSRRSTIKFVADLTRVQSKLDDLWRSLKICRELNGIKGCKVLDSIDGHGGGDDDSLPQPGLLSKAKSMIGWR